jgi:hypothetical protein
MNKNSNNKKTIRRKKSCKKRGNKCTQKHGTKYETKYGGTKPNVCDELPDLKKSLDIFKYAIQLPKITK